MPERPRAQGKLRPLQTVLTDAPSVEQLPPRVQGDWPAFASGASEGVWQFIGAPWMLVW